MTPLTNSCGRPFTYGMGPRNNSSFRPLPNIFCISPPHPPSCIASSSYRLLFVPPHPRFCRPIGGVFRKIGPPRSRPIFRYISIPININPHTTIDNVRIYRNNIPNTPCNRLITEIYGDLSVAPRAKNAKSFWPPRTNRSADVGSESPGTGAPDHTQNVFLLYEVSKKSYDASVHTTASAKSRNSGM